MKIWLDLCTGVGGLLFCRTSSSVRLWQESRGPKETACGLPSLTASPSSDFVTCHTMAAGTAISFGEHVGGLPLPGSFPFLPRHSPFCSLSLELHWRSRSGARRRWSTMQRALRPAVCTVYHRPWCRPHPTLKCPTLRSPAKVPSPADQTLNPSE